MRAEFEQLRKDLMRRIEVIFDKTQTVVDSVEARSSDVLTRNLSFWVDFDRRGQRLFDTLSERLQLPLQRMNEEPPRPH
jgi:hypothetical protein